jgi:hypoxanthine phosphoribosyltransferase
VQAQKFELLYPQDQLARRIKEMGRQISRDYRNKNPLLIGVLKGCIIFLADLIRNISIPIELDFISASRYTDIKAHEERVELVGGPGISLTGRHLLIVEGIVDSGYTIRTILGNLKRQEPASIEIVTLLDKPLCHEVEVIIKYKGFDAGKNFVIGYGLDMKQQYRNLPFIGKVVDE